jgi:protein tyrosine/serine phosphatase
LSTYLVLAAFAVWFSVPVAGQTIASHPDVTAAAVSNIRINNFGRVSAGYYRGAQPEGRAYADLAALGVKTVINLTSDDARADEQEMVERDGMTYVQVPMNTHVPPTSQQIEYFLSLVNDSSKQPVFVHCVGGKHRTGVMTAVYRMTNEGWSADRAFKEMKQYKFGMDFLHPEFKKFVYAYHPDPSRMVVQNRIPAH